MWKMDKVNTHPLFECFLLYFKFADVNGPPPLSVSTALSSLKGVRKHSSNGHPRGESGCCWEGTEGQLTAAPVCGRSDPGGERRTSSHSTLLRVSLLGTSHSFCVQLAHSLQKGLRSRWNCSPLSTISQVAFRIRKSKKYIHRCSLVYLLTLCNLFALICFCLPWDFPF